MFSISSLAPSTSSVTFRTAGSAPTQALPSGMEGLILAGLRDEVLQVLHEGGAIGEHLLPTILQLIPTLDDWPQGLQIALHAGEDAPPRRFGAALDPTHQPVHVMQSGDRYAAAAQGEVAPEHWVDCGPDLEGLFDAVLEGMQQREVWRHLQFTQALARKGGSPCTDAQRLRERLVDQLEQLHPASMRALQDPDVPTQPQHHRRTVDAALLLKISAMSAQEIHDCGGLAQLARDAHVDYSTLKQRVDAAGGLSAPGQQCVQTAIVPGFTLNRITAPLLRDILEERKVPQPRSVGELALHYQVSVHELGTLVSPDLSLKASGQDLLESRPSLLPLTPDVLRTIAGEVENGRIRDHFGLLRAARQHQISFQRLKRLLHPSRGLTGIGRQFLDTSWTPKRIALALNAVQRSTPRAPDQGVSSPGAIVAPRKPVTADLLLEICRNGPAWLASHGGLRHFADFHHFSFTTLKKCVFASTATLTPKGIRKVQKAYPDFTIDEKAATLRAPGRRHKIPSE